MNGTYVCGFVRASYAWICGFVGGGVVWPRAGGLFLGGRRNHDNAAPLSGSEEVPPVATQATGVAKFQLSQDTLMRRYLALGSRGRYRPD